MSNFQDQIDKSILKVEKWVEDHEYKGYEPFDGLSSKFRFITFENLFLNRVFLQLIRQSPINLRPFFGVKPLDSTIGRGYMAWGYCYMYKITKDPRYRKKIDNCLNWLIDNKSPNFQNYSWGKHFDFAGRAGLYNAFEPILIWTALIIHPFLDAYEIFGERKYLEIADSACRWIEGLPRNKLKSGICMGYHYQNTNADVHNSNMMGAAVLARTGKLTDNHKYMELAKAAIDFSCSCQLSNGAWLYGEDPMNHWIDNFHTGYNLDALKCYMEYSEDKRFEKNLLKGLQFYKKNFFEKSGRPKYYHNRVYPIDSQCASQAIDTLANFAMLDEKSYAILKNVAVWTIENMQDQNGFFYYRKYPIGIKAKTPMIHWGQATTYKALSHLAYIMDK